MSYEILRRHREVWKKKEILREIYRQWYRLIVENMIGGRSLEIGGGGGHFKEFFPKIISSDYTFCDWLDLSLDAHNLPFAGGGLGNIVMIDILHHLASPPLFFHEAQRTLKKGGRLILLEPFVSPLSYIIYNYFHQERVDFRQEVFDSPLHEKDPFDGNLAIPSLIFSKRSDRFRAAFPGLKIIEKKYLSFITYPLSGGFDHGSLIPASSIRLFSILEKIIRPFGRLFAFRILVVIEKT